MADMEAQFTKFFSKLDRDLEDLSLGGDFQDAAGNLMRVANVLILLAMAIGQSDEPGKMKPAAALMVRDGKAILAAADSDAAAAAVKAMQSDLNGSSAEPVVWENAVQLSPLMAKVVPSLTTEIKRLSKNEKTLLRAGNVDKVAGDAAALAVVAAGSRLSVSETSAPGQEALWKDCCDHFCAASLKVNETARALENGGAFADYSAALKELEGTCTVCHDKFSGAK